MTTRSTDLHSLQNGGYGARVVDLDANARYRATGKLDGSRLFATKIEYLGKSQ